MANESIDKILSELNKVELMLKQFRDTGKIPDIERDIVLGKLRNMYEFLYLIQLQEVEDPKPAVIQKEMVEEVQIILKEEENTILELEPEILKTPPEEKKDVVVVEVLEKTTETTVEKSIIQTEIKKTEKSASIVAEQFQQKSFLNEALAKFQNLHDFSRKYQTKPIKDISLAISLNDKFLYIKELFGNDPNLYKHTIEHLNNAGDFNQAVQYLDETFKWDFNDFQVQKILEIVHRRYMPSDE